ncbi:amino acid adenylation domain-containing protein [Lysinibacillus sp. RS5]|uniref:amino acid adenylation domain-containing protein n=1 Tax=unclassified Lysinibacillus TaxID=2636778 RepID=UPI0035BE80B0
MNIAIKDQENTISQLYEAPMSYGQRRLWFLQNYDHDQKAYNITFGLKICGSISLEKFKSSLKAIVQRHDVFRTKFVHEKSEYKQIISSYGSLNFEYIDLSNSSNVDQETEVILQSLKEKDYQLDLGNLYMFKLLKICESEYRFFMGVHHIIFDRSSFNSFMSELNKYYSNTNYDNFDQENNLQYSDYSFWQNSWLKEDDAELQMSYWLNKLQGDLPTLRFPKLEVPSHQNISKGTSLKFELEASLTKQIREWCIKQNVTPNMVLMAAYKILLHRYTGEADILLGTPIAGRNQQELEDIIGFFVNTLVIRTTVNEKYTFEEYVENVKDVCLEAYMNQDIPFDKLVEELNPERNLNTTPIVQTFFSMQNTLEKEISFEENLAEFIETDIMTPKTDIALLMYESENGIEGEIQYDTSLFNSEMVKRFARHYQNLLKSVIGKSHLPTKCCCILTEEEKTLFTKVNDVRWNKIELTVNQLIEKRVEESPDSMAIEHFGEKVTYKELNNRANAFAYRLLELNLDKEAPIIVSMDRGPNLIIVLLAILKSGHFYLPVDSSLPKQRKLDILEDSKPSLIIEEKGDFESVKSNVIRVGNSDFLESSSNNLSTSKSVKDLIYLVYTSGSTGKPKGVMVKEEGIIRVAMDKDFFDEKSTAHVSQILSISFDVAPVEIWVTLINGGTIHIANNDLVLSPSDFAHWIKEKQITTMAIPSALFNQMAQEEPYAFSQITNLFIGGEVCSPKSVKQVLEKGGPKHLLNSYGPSENTAITLNYWINAPSRNININNSIPIGTPINNTKVYVLDKYKQQVPIGVPGELYVGGDGLSAGYWNSPDLNREKFIKSPFNDHENLYGTGDIVVYSFDGNILFLGRKDNQVKLRGFRIELGEIEETIQNTNLVEDAVVLFEKNKDNNGKLICYYTSNLDSRKTTLRKELSLRLPNYMVPSIFIKIDKFPLTVNGKIDYRKLPEPTEGDIETVGYEEPQNEIELFLQKIWQDVLKIKEIGVQDNFFEIGGHSLLATQVIVRIAKVLEKNVPIKVLFENPTIRSMALLLSSMESCTYKSIEKRQIKNEYEPLTSSQKSLWFIQQMDPISSAYNIPFAYTLEGKIDYLILEQSIQEIINRHEILRTNFIEINNEPRQFVRPPLSFKLDVVNEINQISEVQNEIQELSWIPFNLEIDTLLRVTLIQVSDNKHILLFVAHHIIFDGWSEKVFIKELGQIYRDITKNIYLTEKNLIDESERLQYRDYVYWHNQIEMEEKDEHLEFWSKELAGELPILELPTDYTRPQKQTFSGESIEINIPSNLVGQLRELSKKTESTSFISLLSIFKILLSRYSGQKDILVGIPTSGRGYEELDNLIGYFVNTIVIRTKLDNEPSFKEFLNQVKNTCLSAFSHQNISFEKLVEEINPTRDLSHTPIFQVMFSHNLMTNENRYLNKILVKPFEVKNIVTKYDLALNINESEDEIRLEVQYNKDLFNRETITKFTNNYLNLLESALSNLDQNVTRLSFLSEGEIGNIENASVNEINSSSTNQFFYELIDQYNIISPDKKAVTFKGESITYNKLIEQSNSIANYLIDSGYLVGSTIGLYAEKSLATLPLVMGIMKAGCTFVPFDPQHPIKRVSYMIEDVGLKAIFTNSDLVKDLNTIADVINLDELWESIKDYKGGMQPTTRHSSESAAYIIYTSGTTGKPKGVKINHKNIMSAYPSWEKVYGMKDTKKYLQIASISFDVFIQDLLRSLCSGSEMILADKNSIIQPEKLYELLYESEIEFAEFVPAVLKYLVSYLKENNRSLPNLKMIVSGADTWYVKDLLEIHKYFDPDVTFINSYGVTEVTIDNTYFIWDKSQKLNSDIVPIGKPFPHVKAYVLDEALQLVPQGAVGELVLGGPTVAEGYHGKDLMTKEKFVRSPFNSKEKLYLTGDLVRIQSSGDLEFIGRKDNQIKIRGYRIETKEIEATIRKHEQVKDSIVAVKESDSNKQLIAFVIPNEGLIKSQLLNYLKSVLPAYMVPYRIEFIDKFPLNDNGKIDRKSLVESFDEGEQKIDADNLPRSIVETRVADIWKEVLGLEIIRIDDNFFELGGHSLNATQVISRLQKKFKITIPLKTIFEIPEVGLLSNFIEQELYKMIELMSDTEEK